MIIGGIDFFNDAEVNVQELSEVSQKQFNEIVEYWKNEVEWYNTGHYSEQFGDPEENKIKEYSFDIDQE